MAKYDLLIKGGCVVDGLGGEPFEGDVAVHAGKIAAVGKLGNNADEVFNAKGLLITPGFVDIHTHYDGQVTWSDRLMPSSAHGVTTAMFGNCGMGFAPCRADDRERLVRLMEGVEDIPEPVLSHGLPWNWTSFPDYLNSLERRAFDIDIAAQCPHAPLRVFVMGERAAQRQPATTEDVSAMSRLAAEAIEAGAFGFTTSRSINHRASDGTHTPTLSASAQELTAIAEAVGLTGKGVLQMIFDFEDIEADFSLVRRLAERSRRPVSMTLVQLPHAPNRWRELLQRIETANQDGLDIKGQVCGRPVGLLTGFDVTYCPFAFCPTYQSMEHLSLSDKMAQLEKTLIRQQILSEFSAPLEMRKKEIARAFASRTVDSFSMARLLTDLSGMYELGEPPNYEPPESASIAAIAVGRSQAPAEVAYDLLMERGGHALLYSPAANFSAKNLDAVRTMLTSDYTILGLSDGGAHCGLICDASFTTYMMTHWARDRHNGMALPAVVRKLTSECARAVGFQDRAALLPGLRADINVINFERLKLRSPRVVYDLPGGGRRLSQGSEGYVRCLVNGVTTYRDGESAGALPGRLVRSPLAGESKRVHP